MRVTNSMIAGRVTYNAQSSLTRFSNLQTQMSSGKRINKPSDDPLGITKDLDYRRELSNNKQYQGNINQAESWYRNNDGTITELHELITAAKGKAIHGADDGASDSATRKLYANELRESIDKIYR